MRYEVFQEADTAALHASLSRSLYELSKEVLLAAYDIPCVKSCGAEKGEDCNINSLLPIHSSRLKRGANLVTSALQKGRYL